MSNYNDFNLASEQDFQNLNQAYKCLSHKMSPDVFRQSVVDASKNNREEQESHEQYGAIHTPNAKPEASNERTQGAFANEPNAEAIAHEDWGLCNGETECLRAVASRVSDNLALAAVHLRHFPKFMRAGEARNNVLSDIARLDKRVVSFKSIYSLSASEPMLCREQTGSNCVALRGALAAELNIITGLFKMHDVELRPEVKKQLAEAIDEALGIARSLTELVCAFRPRFI